MARPRATPEERAGQRERLRRAAVEIYRADGAAGISVRSVTQRAGVSAGTLYSYFGGLSELMRSLWLEPVERAGSALTAIAEANPDPVDRIRALLVGYAEFAWANPEVYRNAVMYVRPLDADPPEAEPADALPFHRLLVAAVTEAREAGRIDTTDPLVTAQVLWAGVHGAIALPVNIDRYALEPPKALVEEMIDRLLRSLAVN